MKRVFACFLMLTVISAVPVLAGDTPWFDFENCAMCKPIIQESGLMEHMSWEVHDLSNGMLTMATVDPEYMGKFANVGAGMEAVKAKLMAGEQLPLCGMCQSMGALIMAGAKVDEVMTNHGAATVLWSTDKDLVAKIHEHARHTNEEMAKMMGSEAHGDHGSH